MTLQIFYSDFFRRCFSIFNATAGRKVQERQSNASGLNTTISFIKCSLLGAFCNVEIYYKVNHDKSTIISVMISSVERRGTHVGKSLRKHCI